jgi:hypothetical protein
MNWKLYEWKRSWPDFKVLSRNFPGEPRKAGVYICKLVYDTWIIADYVASNGWEMNWQQFGRKRSVAPLGYCPRLSLEGLNKTTIILSQYIPRPCRDLNWSLPECESYWDYVVPISCATSIQSAFLCPVPLISVECSEFLVRLSSCCLYEKDSVK